ncbi:MAG: sigma 54-interacting transcriptional regulator [Myxococcota bacterium]
MVLTTEDSLQGNSPAHSDVLALVLLWSREEPDRIGETFLFPPRRGGWTFGRALRQDVAPARVVRPFRQRPGQNMRRPLLASRRISREQLRLRPNRGGLMIENVGSRTLHVNGEALQHALVYPGDCVELHRELLLLCVQRPMLIPGASAALTLHPFGQADSDGLVGESPAAWRLRSRLALVAGVDGHVLLSGPSGSGKELAATAIHRRSGADALVSRNATTFPEGLLDAELFGNARNYPNPGTPPRLGAVGEADGGTLFLDEIGEISHAAQAHLLRVLDGGEFQRLGEDRRRHSRFRLIGATNRAQEALKHDFLARFSRRIALPGLHERREDIPLLARHLLGRFVAKNPHLFPHGQPRLHPRLLQGLVMHDYIAHTRELNKLLWEAVEHWSLGQRGKYIDFALPLPERPSRRYVDSASLTRDEVLAAYRRCGGVGTRVVEQLGLKNRFQLNRLRRKLNITDDDLP